MSRVTVTEHLGCPAVFLALATKEGKEFADLAFPTGVLTFTGTFRADESILPRVRGPRDVSYFIYRLKASADRV